MVDRLKYPEKEKRINKTVVIVQYSTYFMKITQAHRSRRDGYHFGSILVPTEQNMSCSLASKHKG